MILDKDTFDDKEAILVNLRNLEGLFMAETLVSQEEAQGMLNGDLPITPKITRRIGALKPYFTAMQWCYAYKDFVDNVVPLDNKSKTTPAAIMPYAVYFIQEWMLRLKLSKEQLYKFYRGEIPVTPEIDFKLSLMTLKPKGTFLQAQKSLNYRQIGQRIVRKVV